MLSERTLSRLRSKALNLLSNHTGQHKIIAFGIKRRRIASIGINNYTKTHPIQRHYANLSNYHNKIFLHAEIDCLNKAQTNLDAIVVFRITTQGIFRNAKPCAICARAISNANIPIIIHS